MKIASLARLCASEIRGCLILLLALSANASGQGIVYNNGAPNQVNGSEMTSFIEADEFLVANLTTVGLVRFWDFEMANAFAGSIYWSLDADSAGLPGTKLFSGVATNITRNATGLTVSGLAEFSNTFSLATSVLPAGTYWLELHNGPLSNMSSPPNLFWETTSATTGLGSAYVYEPFTETFHRSTAGTENAFILYAAPEPSTWVMLSLGAVGVGVMAMRQRRVVV